ncbi:hypothetical protein SKAU_G00102180 [Synaphobranchus kaupii]|uniref:Uncharacterized protein n=1 Tax=Synaphobranchus kaupii TaxID=118154 RepID=A0A9Q1FYS1_SYNKA|nr:hypothetical protein SKAU_G00102180 [Synaphobranchus kaupii]
MGSKSPSSLQSAPPTEGLKLCDRQQVSIDRFEIYVPKEADVRFVPAETLPPGILKRMGLLSFSAGSDVTVTWISPVVVREKGPCPAPPLCPHKAPPLSHCSAAAQAFLIAAAEGCGSSAKGQGLCWLPVVCSNLTAFKVLRKYMPHGDCQPPDPKWEACQLPCAPLGRTVRFTQDALVIHRGHIFLSIKKMGPGTRVGHRQSLTPEAPPTLPQQTFPCMPRRPQDAQHSWDPSAAPPKKAPQRAAGLRALHLQFGVEHRASVTLANLPDATLKMLSTVGCVDMEKHQKAAQLCCNAEQKNLGSFGSSCTGKFPRNGCAEDLTGTRCSGDRKTGVTHYRGNIMEGEGSKEPVSKKARRVSSGDVSTAGIWGGDGRERSGGDGANGHYGAHSQGQDEAYLPVHSLDYTAGFDFDQSARDEKINRIRARLSEKEAALQQLTLHPL